MGDGRRDMSPAEADFDGTWLVAEYVHDPDGTYRGLVAQTRRLERVAGDRLLVTQHCSPSPELEGHPMARFAGEWVFELEIAGATRRYLGPDVVGFGTQWQSGAMTGQGLWPRFGYEFESYGVLVADDRQLTGGFFSLAGRSVADIVGVAVPESSGIEPRLDLDVSPPEPGDHWHPHRTIGPLLVAVTWPSPSQRHRQWAMRDPIGATGMTITEVVNENSRSVSVFVG